MPIIDLGQHVSVNNDEACSHPDMLKLGHLSTELLLWLDMTRRIEVMRKMDMSANAQNLETRMVSPNFYQTVVRARTAAYVGYRPAYADIDGNLTSLGLGKAELAQRIVEALISAKVEFISVKPANWQTSEEAFVNMVIPIRAARLLKLFKSACLEAEQRDAAARERDREDMPGIHGKPTGAPKLIKTGNSDSTERLQLLDIIETGQAKLVPTDDSVDTLVFDVMTIPAQTSTDAADAPKPVPQSVRQAWVPAAPLSSVARNDLKVLLRFGLVDRRSLFTTNRGRPPSVVRVSPPGEILLKDLHRAGAL